MIFSSASFLVFFAAVLALYAAASTVQQRGALLLAASLIFYASWKPAYLLLLALSLGVNYLLYNRLLRRRSLALLSFAIALNLVVLGVFKYLGLALETASWLAGATQPKAPAWVDWALPLGISFYTFHMLSALIDVYRGTWAKPVRFSRWCLYVTFFPHLIAGPILRPGQLIDQLGELGRLELPALRLGAAIFVGGLVKKALFADNLAPIVDKLYAAPATLDFTAAWLGTLAFAFQIYFDFSGYSEMAIGLARMFGVVLPRNFLYPYISRSPREFWRRWHVTLSLWLRDYLYIPLGGSRGSALRTQVNLFVTMLLGGLWHGASWTFVFWGAVHGLLLAGTRFVEWLGVKAGIANRPSLARAASLLGLPVTFVLICFTWVFFRATHFDHAWRISGAMLGLARPDGRAPLIRLYEVGIIGVSGLVVFLEPLALKLVGPATVMRWWSVPFPLRGAAYAGLALVLLVLGGQTQKFIYFDF